MNPLKEWYFLAPWGKIALISYGNPNGQPVLLVHGRLDSVVTFLPLLKLLPEKYYYVAVEMPGNGKSDHLPKGILVNRFFFVTVLDMIIRDLGWKDYIYIGHSMGAEHGLFLSSMYPGSIKKAIYLDVGASLHRYTDKSFPEFFEYHYENFYGNSNKVDNDRVYSKQGAINAIMKSRVVTAEEADVLLSRNLVEVGDNSYRLSWDRRYKNSPTFNQSEGTILELLTNKQPPSLFICANDPARDVFYAEQSFAIEVITKLKENCKNVDVMWVDGNHDVHFTSPESMVNRIAEFMESNIYKCKL